LVAMMAMASLGVVLSQYASHVPLPPLRVSG
jgi:hypothetical protein